MWDLPIPTFSFSLPLALTSVPEWRMRRLKGVGASCPLCLGGKNFHVPYWPGLKGPCNPTPLQVCTSAGYAGQMWVSLAKCFFKVLQMVGMKLRLVPSSGLFPSERWLMSLIWIVSLRNPPGAPSFLSPPVITMPINILNVIFICVIPIYPKASFSSLPFLLPPLGCI